MLPSVYEYFAIALLFFVPPLSSLSTEDYFSELKTAISVSDVNTVDRLLLQNSEDWLNENRGWEIARIAAEKGNLPVIKYIAERELSILEKKNEENETIGHIAAKHGHPKITEYFLNETSSDRWSPSGSERKSLFDLTAQKGYLNCILGRVNSYSSDDVKRIGKIAAQNGHLNIACYVAMETNEVHCKEFSDIIRTAMNNSRQTDPSTLELFAELTDEWGTNTDCLNMVELAMMAKNVELIEYLAEKKSTYFLKCEPVYTYAYFSSSYFPCRLMEIAFEQNLVNENFLDCLEKGNGTVQGYIGRSQLTIGHLAVKHKRLAVIQFLAEKNASILDRVDGSGKKVVDIAAEKGYADIVRYAVRRQPLTTVRKLWNRSNGNWWHAPRYSTAFHQAIAENFMDMDTLKYVVEKEGTDIIIIADPDDGETVAHAAARNVKLQILRYLVKKKPSVLSMTDSSGDTALHILARSNNFKGKWLIFLVDRGAPFQVVKNHEKDTVGHILAKKGHADSVEYLAKKNSSIITSKDRSGDTIVHLLAKTTRSAVRNSTMEIIRHLVEEKPSVLTILDSSGDTVLHILARNNNLKKEMLTFLVDKGAPLQVVKNREKDTVGHILAKEGHADSVEYLAKKNPSIITSTDKRGDTIVHLLARTTHSAARNATMEIIQHLVKKKSSVLSKSNCAGDTILHILARMNEMNVKELRFFVNEGASLLACNHVKESIPLIASKNGNLEILQFVVEKESSVVEGNASIAVEMAEAAASRGHSNILKFIVDKKPILLADRPQILFKLPEMSQVLDTLQYLKIACDTKITNWDRAHFESQVLREAYDRDNPDILRLMKYDVNTMNDQGEPAIFTAVRRYRSNIFYYLADDGRTNLTALDRQGNNILFIAAAIRNLETMQHILDTLKAPIDLEWRNNEGDTVLHVAVNEALEQAITLANEKKQFEEVSGDDYHSGEVDTSVMKYLVEVKHANINALGRGNKTVLCRATSRSNYDICNYLLNHGADPKFRHANEPNFWHEIRFPSLYDG